MKWKLCMNLCIWYDHWHFIYRTYSLYLVIQHSISCCQYNDIQCWVNSGETFVPHHQNPRILSMLSIKISGLFSTIKALSIQGLCWKQQILYSQGNVESWENRRMDLNNKRWHWSIFMDWCGIAVLEETSIILISKRGNYEMKHCWRNGKFLNKFLDICIYLWLRLCVTYPCLTSNVIHLSKKQHKKLPKWLKLGKQHPNICQTCIYHQAAKVRTPVW